MQTLAVGLQTSSVESRDNYFPVEQAWSIRTCLTQLYLMVRIEYIT